MAPNTAHLLLFRFKWDINLWSRQCLRLYFSGFQATNTLARALWISMYNLFYANWAAAHICSVPKKKIFSYSGPSVKINSRCIFNFFCHYHYSRKIFFIVPCVLILKKSETTRSTKNCWGSRVKVVVQRFIQDLFEGIVCEINLFSIYHHQLPVLIQEKHSSNRKSEPMYMCICAPKTMKQRREKKTKKTMRLDFFFVNNSSQNLDLLSEKYMSLYHKPWILHRRSKINKHKAIHKQHKKKVERSLHPMKSYRVSPSRERGLTEKKWPRFYRQFKSLEALFSIM